MEKKIYFSYGSEAKEGFIPQVPMTTSILINDSVDEIYGHCVIEKVPNLIAFIDECHRLLRPGGKASFTSPHYASIEAWASPLVIRGVGDYSLNFASKEWRETNKYTEASVLSDFEVSGSFTIEETLSHRAEEARNFFLKHYNNVVRLVHFTLTKKQLVVAPP